MTGPDPSLHPSPDQLRRLERLAAFGELAAGISHEVKNPITVIIGFAQIAQRRLDDPEQVSQLLKLIEQEGLRCKELLMGILALARGDEGGKPVREPLDPNGWLQGASSLLAHQFASRDLRLQVELGEDVPAVVANPRELTQVLMNLALNAQDAMKQGGVLKLATSTDRGGVVLSVADDGNGMSPEVRERLFEPFFTTRGGRGGTGLGLAICARIVSEHGGDIAVESVEGSGTTFRIWLPAAVSADTRSAP